MLNWHRIMWLMGKLASPSFQVKVEIVEVCLKTLIYEEKRNMFWESKNWKSVGKSMKMEWTAVEASNKVSVVT